MIDEKALIDRAKGGDRQAFKDLVEHSRMNVYRLAYSLTGSREDAEDLSQDVFVKAYRSLDSFRADAKWSTWLYRITVNTCMDHGRTKSPRSQSINEDTDNLASAEGAGVGQVLPDRSANSKLMKEHIESALNSLSSQERSVFVLRHYHDLPLKHIAETLQLAEGTVKSHLFRALQRLRRELSFYRVDLGMDESV